MSMPSDALAKLIHNLDSLTYGSWNETPADQHYGESVQLSLSFIDPITGLPGVRIVVAADD